MHSFVELFYVIVLLWVSNEFMLSIYQCFGLLHWHSGNVCFTMSWDVIKWKHFPRYWPFVRGIHRSPVKSPHKGQWRGALIFSLICAWIHGWVNNGEAGDLRRHQTQYDVIVMYHWSNPTATHGQPQRNIKAKTVCITRGRTLYHSNNAYITVKYSTFPTVICFIEFL